jgi:hypothetical protein
VQLFKCPFGLLDAQQADAKASSKPASAAASNAAKAAAGKPGAASSAGAARMSTVDEAAAEQATPPEPCTLLSPEQASVFNPLVLHAYKAACLPDAPATRQQLETLCEKVSLKAVWPPLVSDSHWRHMCWLESCDYCTAA